MKVGDLVNYFEGRTSERIQGLIVDGPKRDFLEHYGDNPQWEVFWMDQRNDDGSIKIGWWDEFRLEVISVA